MLLRSQALNYQNSKIKIWGIHLVFLTFVLTTLFKFQMLSKCFSQDRKIL